MTIAIRTLGVIALAAGLSACGAQPLTAAQIYEKARPAVVMIQAAPTQTEPVGSPDGPDCTAVGFGRGTGFVIDTAGYIATNAHVVDPCPNAFPNQRLTVKTASGETLEAVLVGVDQVGDVALLKVDHTFDTALSFADSTKVRPGEDVVAMGFPGSLDGEATITRGVVSVASRSYDTYGSVVQTDAAVNHGNSGGPLLNDRAEVIGINTFIYRPQADFEAINFALSAKVAAREISDIREYGNVIRADLGVIEGVMIDEGIAVQQNFVENPYSLGMLIQSVEEGSPLDGQLKACDVIDRIDGAPIRSEGDFNNALMWAKSGQPMKIEFLRYPEDKCRLPDPCAGKTVMSSWNTGCPLDLALNTSGSSGLPSLSQLLLDSEPRQPTLEDLVQAYMTETPSQKQARIDADAQKILEAHRADGVPSTIEVIPN